MFSLSCLWLYVYIQDFNKSLRFVKNWNTNFTEAFKDKK